MFKKPIFQNTVNKHRTQDTEHRTQTHVKNVLWGGGGKKHEIYVAALGSHLFHDLFLQGWWGEGAWSPRPPGSATVLVDIRINNCYLTLI